MSAKLLDRARAKQIAAEQRLQKAKEELELASKEVARWQIFFETAESLEADIPNESSGPASQNGHHARVTVQRDSHAGFVAQLLIEKGSLTLQEIMQAMIAKGKGETGRQFKNNVNSALWRRKHDLFKKTKKQYELRTTEIEFV